MGDPHPTLRFRACRRISRSCRPVVLSIRVANSPTTSAVRSIRRRRASVKDISLDVFMRKRRQMADPRALLSIRNIVKQFRVGPALPWSRQGIIHAVDGVSLGIEKGETVGLVGESGCGKSTLARAIMLLDRPE